MTLSDLLPAPMKKDFFHFLKRLSIFSFVLACIAVVLWFIAPRPWLTPTLPFLFLFFMGSTILSFYYLQRSTRERFARFVNTFLLTILLKLLGYACILFAYAFLNPGDVIPFILAFFLLYLCYTVFESAEIIRLTRSSRRGPNG